MLRDLTTNSSAGGLLDLVRKSGGISRSELLRLTGIARSTLYERLDQLFRSGLVYEAESRTSTGGRPAKVLRLDDRNKVVVVFDLGQTRSRVAVMDLDAQPLSQVAREVAISAGPEQVLGPLVEHARSLCSRRQVVVGIAASVPAPVDSRTGELMRTTIMQGWGAHSVQDYLRSFREVAVLVENDARAMALGETHDDRSTKVVVKFANGLGCGIVVNGRVLTGVGGAAGDIGHIRILGNDLLCNCGRRGCLATLASGRAVLNRLGMAPSADLDAVVSLADAGDPRALAELARASSHLGTALANTVATINPDEVILGGILGRYPFVAQAVREQILKDAHHSVTDGLRVRASVLGEQAVSIGLGRLVVNDRYDARRIDGLVSKWAGTQT